MIRQSIALAAVALCLALFGCGKRSTSKLSTEHTPPPGRKLRLAVVADSRSGSELAIRAGCNRAAADLPNVTLDFQHPPNSDAPTQKRIIDDLLARSTDGIAISPVDPESQNAALGDAAQQTLLFTQNNDVPDSGRACFIGTDRVAAGQQMAAAVRELLPDGGRVFVLVGPPGNRPAQERFDGLRQSLPTEKFELFDVAAGDADLAKILAGHPETNCFVGLTPNGGPALLRALREVRPGSAAKLVCADAEKETLQGIRDGLVAASIVEQSFEIGRQTIITMNRALNGDTSGLPPSGVMFVPVKVLRRDSVDAYAKTLEGLPAN